jgi:hypothetical protein
MRLPHAAALLVCLTSFAATAQDDLLAPLDANKPKPKPKPKAKPVPHVKRPAKPSDDEMVGPLVKKKAQIAIKVTPSSKDAVLFVDGNSEGLVPDHPLELTPGEHTLTVKRPGYADFTKRLTVGEGQVLELGAALEATSGVLTVSSEPDGAEVLVDGRPMGSAPLRDMLLSSGGHDVLVRNAGYEDDLSHLIVKPGKQYNVAAHLKAAPPAVRTLIATSDRPEVTHLTPSDTAVKPVSTGVTATADDDGPLYKRWYFWAGAAAVVAAAVVAGIVVANNGNASSPTGFAVCGPAGCNSCLGAPAGTPGCH